MSDNTNENISSQFTTLTNFLQNIVDKEETGGISCLLYHEGQVRYQKAFGWKDHSKQERIRLDTIHRIYSMTKPILCVAVLILYEEGKLDLNDPISKY
ncbi:MAG: serine hydrolase domain-containing protein, partial [Promethearchaeota archaeon]